MDGWLVGWLVAGIYRSGRPRQGRAKARQGRLRREEESRGQLNDTRSLALLVAADASESWVAQINQVDGVLLWVASDGLFVVKQS